MTPLLLPRLLVPLQRLEHLRHLERLRLLARRVPLSHLVPKRL